MTQETLEALLGRSLTATEVTNLDLYLDIANDTVGELLCMNLTSKSETRVFDVRNGYRTVFTHPFVEVDEVQDSNGNIIDEDTYTPRQWDKRNADWYNSIVMDDTQCGEELTISGTWGFGKCMPKDLQLLVARSFDQISKSQGSNGLVKRKEVEDFKIEFNTDVTQQEQFYADNALIIQKYSMCNIGDVQHGCVPSVY